MKNSFDVAVIGGGPAGAAAALTLLKYSKLRVAVVEKSNYSQVRVGETVSPGLQPLLGYLGVWEIFLAEHHLPAYGTCAAWGGPELQYRDFLFTGHGNGWHLDRRRFDHMLANRVEEHGGVLFTNTQVTGYTKDVDNQWHLSITQKDGKQGNIAARLIIDASGKGSVFAKRIGAYQQIYDRLVGVVGLYDSIDKHLQSHLTLVEACADGWWYLAPVPGGRAIVAFMTDIDILRYSKVQITTGWDAMLGKTQHTREQLVGGRLCLPLQVRHVYSHLLKPICGAFWIATGDAAASFDPLASMGIGHAISSGTHAARVAHDLLTSDGSLMHQYSGNIILNFHNYLELRRQYYLIEQRWQDHPFWAKRHDVLHEEIRADTRIMARSEAVA